jgi:hypothetical protein
VVIVCLDVIDDIPLGDTNMLQQVPKGVIAVRRPGVDMFLGEIGHCILEIHVCLADAQHACQLLPQLSIVVHAFL